MFKLLLKMDAEVVRLHLSFVEKQYWHFCRTTAGAFFTCDHQKGSCLTDE
jgi:hypothetical protein